MNKPQNKKTGMIMMLVLFLPVAWLAIKLSMVYVPDEIIWTWLPTVVDSLKVPFDLEWTDNTLSWVGFAALLFVFAIAYYKVSNGKRRIGREHGSAAWAAVHELNKKYAQEKATDKIISKDLRMGLDDRKHRHNLNTLVIGAPGSGKSMGFVKPNIMQCKCLL